ncbi:hypothetical protein jhhlp_005249 [Lomentospora prolificans]|uniref:Apple domain-containing protein n=1 Tax=Lomentospora prolificans TaxID=41688 RepID=A0A2N3N791_9PEZI|nr:hypothetical protein jhhlp_005249 [Lomentospora prolificans]
MKFRTLVVLFVAAAEARKGSRHKDSECKASLCKSLSREEKRECRELLGSVTSVRTVTSTVTVGETSVVTSTIVPAPDIETVSTIITQPGPAITPDVTTVTAVTTQIDTVTVTDTSFATQFSTVFSTDVETDIVTATEYFTAISTSWAPYVFPTCPPVGKRRLPAGSRGELPEKCSCLLSPAKSTTTVTTTVTAADGAVISTVYETGSQDSTITNTVTLTSFADGPIVSVPEATETLTETVTQTDRAVTTVTEEQIETSVVVTTKTQVETASVVTSTVATSTYTNPCHDLESLKISGHSISHPNVVRASLRDSNAGELGHRDCCESCYAGRGCVYFRHVGSICETYTVQLGLSMPCTSDTCARGKSDVYLSSPNEYQYFIGACVGNVIQVY